MIPSPSKQFEEGSLDHASPDSAMPPSLPATASAYVGAAELAHRPQAPPPLPPPAASSSSSQSEFHENRRAKRDLFGDCALVEIIHLHDCLRGAVGALQRDVNELTTLLAPSPPRIPLSVASLSPSASAPGYDPPKPSSARVAAAQTQDRIAELERRVAGRFKVIWSVFKAHSAAEDEFIWPALQSKQSGRGRLGSFSSDHALGGNAAETVVGSSVDPNASSEHGAGAIPPLAAVAVHGAVHAERDGERADEEVPCVIEQEEYEEDHANEESMFQAMDSLLSQLREGLSKQRRRSLSYVEDEDRVNAKKPSSLHSGNANKLQLKSSSSERPLSEEEKADASSIRDMAQKIDEVTSTLSQHLMTHLDKEEAQCMPLVRKHLSKSEINDLVGKIMGRRSSDLMSQIMNMAVQNLDDTDRNEMVRYMKQAMVGTFFERWLSMGGWMEDKKPRPPAVVDDDSNATPTDERKMAAVADEDDTKLLPGGDSEFCPTRTNAARCVTIESGQRHGASMAAQNTNSNEGVHSHLATHGLPAPASATSAPPTSDEELQRLIRAIASNPKLTAVQKNTTIQGLRDSVWRKQQSVAASAAASTESESIGGVKRKLDDSGLSVEMQPDTSSAVAAATAASASTGTRCRRVTPPSAYYKKSPDGKVVLVWSSDSPSGGGQFPPNGVSVPLFSASELAPTYFDGATGAVLGCPHYARSCKLRHPSSGRLYTCRLCCEQERDMPMKDQDSPLDRYAVSEVLCMRCGALQPAADGCCNPKCESHGKPYSKYTCRICNFYDDHPQKDIYHCPFCNVCRNGKGLGIDYRHCMRCNACVSLKDDEHHCIPQRLQGNCPICHESMFQSTEPLRGLKCGHVMHLSCYSHYMRGHSYTCPLCKKSVEDMKEYFSILDSAVRMQPMPAAYSHMISNIYCQDCGQTGSVRYHFVGCKCAHCGSYNTRELGRIEEPAADHVQY